MSPKYIILTIISTVLNGQFYSQSIVWTNSYNQIITSQSKTYSLHTEVNDVVCGTNGALYIAGRYEGDVNDNIPGGAYLNKYDGTGAVEWSVNVLYNWHMKLAISPNGYIGLIAADSTKSYIAFYDQSDGSLISKTSIFSNNPLCAVTGLEFEPAGSFYITGTFTGPIQIQNESFVPTNSSDQYMFVARFHSSGSLAWLKVSSKGSIGKPCLITLGSAVCVGFNYTGAFQLASYTLTTNTTTGFDCAVMKLDSNGSYQWCREFRGDDMQEIVSLSHDISGNLVVAGCFLSELIWNGTTQTVTPNNVNAYFASFNQSGNPLSIHTFGQHITIVFDTDLDPDGNLYWSGGYSGNITLGGQNYTTSAMVAPFLCRLSPNGQISSVLTSVVSGYASGGKVARDSLNNIYYIGNYTGELNFQSHQWKSGQGVFILKLAYETETEVQERYQPSGFLIYPVPSQGKFQIEAHGIIPGIYKINVYDIFGKQVYHESLQTDQTHSTDFSSTIDMHSMDSGEYIIEVVRENQEKEAIVIKRQINIKN
jgi:hypothetical protein